MVPLWNLPDLPLAPLQLLLAPNSLAPEKFDHSRPSPADWSSSSDLRLLPMTFSSWSTVTLASLV